MHQQSLANQAKALRIKGLVFDASIAASTITDINGVITEANDAFLRLWDSSGENEVIGKSLDHFLNETSEAPAIITALDETGQWEGDFEAKKKGGETFIANGLPVMIEEGDLVEDIYWPNDDQWTGHYLLLTGYDDNAEIFVAQDSFRGPDREVSFDKTDERWEAYNRVYILIYPPDKENLVKSIKYIFAWGIGLGLLFTILYSFWGSQIISLYTNNESVISLTLLFLFCFSCRSMD